ncbi:hypothetical protein D3C85_1375040 [compost metagenome]
MLRVFCCVKPGIGAVTLAHPDNIFPGVLFKGELITFSRRPVQTEDAAIVHTDHQMLAVNFGADIENGLL